MSYNKRTWLNSSQSDSTGSIVAFDGEVTYKGDNVPSRFLEISDCQTKVRLHQTWGDSKDDFIFKMRLLKSEIELFISHLEKSEQDDTRIQTAD